MLSLPALLLSSYDARVTLKIYELKWKTRGITSTPTKVIIYDFYLRSIFQEITIDLHGFKRMEIRIDESLYALGRRLRPKSKPRQVISHLGVGYDEGQFIVVINLWFLLLMKVPNICNDPTTFVHAEALPGAGITLSGHVWIRFTKRSDRTTSWSWAIMTPRQRHSYNPHSWPSLRTSRPQLDTCSRSIIMLIL